MWIAVFVLVLLAGLPASAFAQADNEFCLGCHKAPDAAGPPVEGPALETSAHRTLSCVACHGKAEEVPHPEGMARPACGLCHATETKEYAFGVAVFDNAQVRHAYSPGALKLKFE